MSVEPRTADELTRVIRAWLDADDSTHWGDFEKALDSIINPSETELPSWSSSRATGSLPKGMAEMIEAVLK